MKFELDIKTFDEISSKRPNVYCKGFIPLQEGSPTMLYAGGGTGKSYASVRMAIEYALETGKKAALWLTEDPAGENKFRFNSICNEFYPQHRQKIVENVRVINSPPVRFTKLEKGNAVITSEFLQSRLALADYGMVVIDPLIQFNGCDENSNSHAGVLMGEIKAWANEENKVLVLIHHITVHENGVKARGAGEWNNACRAVYLVGKPSEGVSDDHLKFTLTKNNGIAWCFKNDAGELERELRIFPPWGKEESQQEQPNNKLFLSIATHNSAKKPDGFIKVEVDDFYKTHTMVTVDRCYSQYDFEGGYRLGANNLGAATMICLDFDDGMTIEQAKTKFAKVQSLIVTTRSHQIMKSGKKCDRFRVIMPLDKPLSIPVSDYSDFLNCMNDVTGGEVDPSTKDLARFYFASPGDAFFLYSDSQKRLNWQLIYDKMKKQRVKKAIEKKLAEQPAAYPRHEYSGQPRNTLPADTMFETKSGSRTFADFRSSLSFGEKVICRCRLGIDHGSEGPNHYSAFVQKSDNGNVFYHCSGGRCAAEGSLWCEE
jgi:hypothetical protein